MTRPSSTPLRVVIADDERIARERLRAMLGAHPDVVVAAECRDGAEAVRALRELDVDMVFLDVRMPELDGFEVVRTVGVDAMPRVVFVTAYDEFAIRAFESRAVDYLLKPFDDARLAETIARLRSSASTRPMSPVSPVSRAAAGDLLPDDARVPADRLVVRADGRMLVLRAADIDWIEAADDHVRVHVGKTVHVMRGRISMAERRLDARRFARIHRSTIVNLDRVREVQPMFRGDYVALLHDGTRLPITASYRETLFRALGTPL